MIAVRRRKKSLLWALVVLGLGSAAVVLFLGLDSASDKRFAALVTLLGVVLTAGASLISERRLERQHMDEEARLRLDAAMNAGALFNANGSSSADPAAVASGLLALTQLARADLAVALLVDLWDWDVDERHEGSAASAPHAVSDETAILVIDAALRSADPSAQLVAAELLCRNARRLDLCQSLHWPSSVDGRWNPAFGIKTKVLIVDALVHMAYTTDPSQNALQSLAVRLYGISAGDPDPHVRGCVGMLLEAVVPSLLRLHVRSLMQGPSEITIDDIRQAADHARANPDRVFYDIVRGRSIELKAWADRCRETDESPGALAAAAVSR